MNIQSVIPNSNGLSTQIWAAPFDGNLLPYSYSHDKKLITNPRSDDHDYLPFNGGTLTKAIQFIVSL